MAHEEFLARVPIFANCTAEEVEAISGVAQEGYFQPNQIIVTQGTPGQAFYLILSGRVEILRDGVSWARSGRETSSARVLLDQAPRSATIRALDHTSCLMLSSWDFKTLLTKHPSIAIKLLEVLSRRLRVADERMGADMAPQATGLTPLARGRRAHRHEAPARSGATRAEVVSDPANPHGRDVDIVAIEGRVQPPDQGEGGSVLRHRFAQDRRPRSRVLSCR